MLPTLSITFFIVSLNLQHPIFNKLEINPKKKLNLSISPYARFQATFFF